MTTRPLLPLLALGLAAAGAAPVAAQSVNDFQLPPNPSPTPSPRAQGPVDDSGTVPIAPRPIATPTPTPRPTTELTLPTPRPTAQPAEDPRPQPTPPVRQQLPAARPGRAPDAAATAAPPAPGSAGTAADLPGSTAPAGDPAFELPAAPGQPPPTPAGSSAPEPQAALPQWWWMAALGGVLLAALAALAIRRRRAAGATAPEIVRPLVADSGGVSSGSALEQLRVEVQAVRLSRSVMAATLSYRIALSNRASVAIRHLELDGDLTSAHGMAPVSEQLADAATALPPLHRIDHLGAGQSKTLTGELRLELKNVRPIRQGSVPIYVPLLRLKARSADGQARAFTFVVGKLPGATGARLQPFRLDTPPQSFNEIGARALA